MAGAFAKSTDAMYLSEGADVFQVVAFVKGTRRQPQCGFSYKVLSMLNELGANYEVLNVLDEVYNPGLREAIKEYSQWPTIPQVCRKRALYPTVRNPLHTNSFRLRLQEPREHHVRGSFLADASCNSLDRSIGGA